MAGFRLKLVATAAVLLVVLQLALQAEAGCPCSGSKSKPPVRPRHPAPAFSGMAVAPDESFKRVSLEDYKGKWLVLFFFPFAFTFVCPTEIVAFSDAAAELRKMNTEVLGVSTDSHHTHLAWRRTAREDGGLGPLDIDLVGDFSKHIARDYGVLVEDEGDDMFGAALRGVFVIDPKGTVRSIQVNDDAVGRSVDEVVRLVQAFQFVGAHDGKVCPANWQPGDDTIVASPVGARDFWAADGITHAAQPHRVADKDLAIRKGHVEEDVRTVCLRIGMAAALPDTHHKIEPSRLRVKQIGGGITNKLFRCDHEPALEGSGQAPPATVLVRWFGENTERFIDREREGQVMRELTEQGFGCAALGYFSNGRIETFLHGYKALEVKDFGTPFITRTVSEQLATMHRLHISGDRSPVLFKTLRKWVALALTVTLDDPEKQKLLESLDVTKLIKELDWLEAASVNVPSELVVAHNDLLPANIMRKGDDISFIDFEYSDFNPRGFDIANHFCEFTGFECDFDGKYPDEDTRRAFYMNYLQHYHDQLPSGKLEVEAMIRTLEAEVKFYSLASNLYWGVWGILQEAFSTIPFDYLPYSARRVARYYEEKEALGKHMHVGL